MHKSLAISQISGCVHQQAGQIRAGLAASLSTTAVLSLYKEVSLYPKPGLVSPIDSGSHKDMDYQMFLASINSLREYFGKVSEAGAAGETFSVLQRLGIEAEARMMSATKGVNTHRGAIFNLGLLCAATAYLNCRYEQVTPERLGTVISESWGSDILATSNMRAYTGLSHGQQVVSRYGVQGARQEAVAGFPAARHHGLPAYRDALEKAGCKEAAAVQALFALMAHLDDTNILWRGGERGLRHVKSVSKAFLDAGGVSTDGWKSKAIEIHDDFVRENLSPGGAADLLGVTLFMNAVCV